jgi:UDP-GlcNAc:undecaprenyl-phosphate GlcNAc-1-phosphate transferase
VFLFYALSILYGVVAVYLARNFTLPVLIIAAFIGIVILLFLGVFLFEVTTPAKLYKFPREHTVLNSIFMYKRRIIEVILDFGFICVAYYAAYFLRFEGGALQSNLVLLKDSILWVILIKLIVFFSFGLYRGVWRYSGIHDLITGCKVVSIASVAVVLFLTFIFRFNEYSRKVLVIDWLILLFLVLGSRVLIRVIAEFFVRMMRGGEQVLIVGAGDTGEMVVREIKRNHKLRFVPVGFLDDDRSKKGNEIHGVKVLGGLDRLAGILDAVAVSRVFIAIPTLDSVLKENIVKTCDDAGVACKVIKGMLDE